MVNIIEKNMSNSILNNNILKNEPSNNKFDIYKSDSLFLLIGTNPLPNYVAFKLLTKPSSHIFFVHTDETNQVADRLLYVMNLPPERYTKINVDEANADNIYSKIIKFAKGRHDIGLNYTGGTKSMAVHSYRAILAADPDAIFSYLDARRLEMLIETRNSSKNETVGLILQPSLNQLLALHGLTPKQSTIEPYKADFCQEMAKIPCKELRKWCDNNLRCGEDTPIRNKKNLKSVQLPFQPPFDKLVIYFKDCNTLEDLEKKWQWNDGIMELARFLDGKWLEHYTLWGLQQNKLSSKIHEAILSLKTNERDFELDIAALKGYQLFAISCTTDFRKKTLKQKLFEAYVRAHQLGGDEAKIGVVCFAPPENPESNSDIIRKEIEEEWDVKNKFRVFGAEHVQDLPTYLKEWFNSN